MCLANASNISSYSRSHFTNQKKKHSTVGTEPKNTAGICVQLRVPVCSKLTTIGRRRQQRR